MEIWIAAGDETGSWDIVNDRFGSERLGVAWVLGTAAAWENALQQDMGGSTALQAFSSAIASRVPGASAPAGTSKYHVMDVWRRYRKQPQELAVDVPNDDPWLERVRADACWLLQESGLSVLAASGTPADARAVGLGRSGDGLRERARAFAGLMTVALPFLPGDASLNMMIEGRTEATTAAAARLSQNAESADGNRYLEPYRDFIGRLQEDLQRSAERCRPIVADGTITDKFYSGGKSLLNGFLKNHLKGFPFLSKNAAEVTLAMNGIADLAAALAPRAEGEGCRLLLPDGSCGSIWTGNFRDLRHAFER